MKIKHFINSHPDNILSRTYRFIKGESNHININVPAGNLFAHKEAWVAGSTVKVIGKNNDIIFGRSIFAHNIKIFVKGNNNKIVIDDEVLLKNVEFWIEDDDNAIEIGFGTHFTGKIQLAAVEGSRIKVGKNCLFSSDINLRTSDSHSILDYGTMKRINPAADISIGNHCWFGHRTTILKGVNMSEDVIVAAGSIVTKSIEESHVIIGGTPATIIKRGVTWDEQRI